MIRSLTAEVKGMLAAEPFPTYVGVAPDNAPSRYVVLHPDQAAAEESSFAGDSEWRPWRFITHCFGTTPDQAQAVYERVEAAFLDVTPTVSGRSCTPIRKESSLPISRDEDVQPPVFLARDAWVFSSVPA